MIKLVEQEEPFGCVIACIAMVMNRTYSDVRKDWHNDFEKEGVEIEKVTEYLAENGYTVVHKEMTNWMHRDKARKEMLRPFAPAHIVRFHQFCDAPFGHVAVMTNKGKFLCPQKTDAKALLESYAVSYVIGVFN